MRITVCDRCGKILSDKRRGIFERWDQVSLSKAERVDLCKDCYPHYQEMKQRQEEFAASRIRELREVEEQFRQEFWKDAEGKYGTTPTEG